MDFARQLTHELGLTESLSEQFTMVFGFQAQNILEEFINALGQNGYEASLFSEVRSEGGLLGVDQLVIYRKRSAKPKITVLNLDVDSKLTIVNHRTEVNLDLQGPHRIIIKQLPSDSDTDHR